MSEVSNVLIVNGVQFPTPDAGFTISRSQLADAERNANGEMVASKINRRMFKFDGLTWSDIMPEQWQIIAKEIDKFFGVVRVWDDRSLSYRFIDFYWGDDKAVPLRTTTDGVPTIYKSCSCNIIDMGLPFRSGF